MLNADLHGVRSRMTFRKAAFGEALDGPFDIVVSNPPYIRSDVLPTLAREVRDHDPRAALDGGPDGLSAYRAILAHASELLRDDGILAIEIGYDQGKSVAALCRGAGLAEVTVNPDLAGRDASSWGEKGCRGPIGRGQKNRLEKLGDSG